MYGLHQGRRSRVLDEKVAFKQVVRRLEEEEPAQITGEHLTLTLEIILAIFSNTYVD